MMQGHAPTLQGQYPPNMSQGFCHALQPLNTINQGHILPLKTSV